jgi:protein arginine kinase
MSRSAEKVVLRDQTHELDLDELIATAPAWLQPDGEYSDIVISSRIRLARNLAGYLFPHRAKKIELESVLAQVLRAAQSSTTLKKASFCQVNRLGQLDRAVLVERHLVSPQFAEQARPSGLLVTRDEQIGVMINEEDHLRLQAIQPGLSLNAVWSEISRLDDELGDEIEYAFSEQFGFLTSCPTNTGTGMRASVFIHLPALSVDDRVSRTIKELAPSEMTIRGFYGEGSEALGNLYQISNQLTLGRTETGILKRLEEVVVRFVELEQEQRAELMKDDPVKLEDKVFRALGVLERARILSSLEFMNSLSWLRLGVELGLVEDIAHEKLNELLVVAQPAHIQKLQQAVLTAEERDVVRARIVREKLEL